MSEELIDPPFVAETLAWCNEKRAERDLLPLSSLPLGIQSDPKSCPCGKATGLYVDQDYYTNTREEWFRDSHKLRKKLPFAVRDFVCAFDEGELPQYEEEVPYDPDQY